MNESSDDASQMFNIDMAQRGGVFVLAGMKMVRSHRLGDRGHGADGWRHELESSADAFFSSSFSLYSFTSS